METILKKITNDKEENDKIYEMAGQILKKGGLVAFPTETVYGLGGDALDSSASGKIYSAKGRPSDNPLIVHIADVNDLYKLSCDVNESALKLAKTFWPGPLTMILKKSEIVPYSITGGLETVAIRMPSHPVASELIRRSGLFIAAPSANTSGKPSPTKAEHVINDLSGKIDMIIEDDTVDIGVESTIIDLSEDVPSILRPGYITQKMLESALGVEVTIDPAIEGTIQKDVVPKAPGMKYKHYSPDANVVIVTGSTQAVINKINELAQEKLGKGERVGIMATQENSTKYSCGIIKVMGSSDDEASIARNLFAALRDFDKIGVKYVYSESFPTNNVGKAVMNRLVKAAGHTIINADEINVLQ